ncbi:MAG TPA: TolC family protein, partial [Blastocatellia bacterium]|nr:TolC family protein [Blastocatellia bacterium]
LIRFPGKARRQIVRRRPSSLAGPASPANRVLKSDSMMSWSDQRYSMATYRNAARAMRVALSMMVVWGLISAAGYSYAAAPQQQAAPSAPVTTSPTPSADVPAQRQEQAGAADSGQGRAQGEDGSVNGSAAGRVINPGIPATMERREPQQQAPAKPQPVEQQKPRPPLDTSAITEPLPVTAPVGHERTGVNLNQVESLSLQDAIRLALLNNLTIEQFRQGVQISQYALFAARGVYDITSSAQINFQNFSVPSNQSFFVSGAENGVITQKTVNFNFSATQNFERTGANWQAFFGNSRTITSSFNSLLSPQYSEFFQFIVTQPLMRNFSIDANRQTIQLDKAQLDLSDSQFRQQVIQIINKVQDAYWELGFAIQNEKIARDTYDLTHKQLEDNKKQIEAGTLAPLDLRQTEATLENNKGAIIAAKQQITTDENNLKILLLKDPQDQRWNSAIKPIDDPEFEVVKFSLADAVALALKNRPELEQLRLQELQNRVSISYFKNQLKPQVNVFGSYAVTGLAGTPTAIANHLGGVPSTFNAGYFGTLGQLFKQEFRTIQFGVTFSFPWRNRTAQGNLGRALAQENQTEANEKAELQQVEIDVRNALQAVDAARESYMAAVAGRKAAYAQYVGEEEKFRAGLSTTYYVLQQETAYSNAQGTEARALANYRQALSDFQRVTATTLVSNNVEIPSTSQAAAPNPASNSAGQPSDPAKP